MKDVQPRDVQPTTAPARPALPPPRARRRRVLAGRAAALLGLVALTGWNLIRSDALDEAREASARKRNVMAVRLALDHLDRRPWSREAARIAGRSLSRLGYAAQAEPYYRRGGPLGPGDLHARAFGLLRANDRDEARRAYEAILQRWPDDPIALRHLAVLRMLEGDLGASVELSERLARVPGQEVVGLTMVGTYQNHSKEFELAVAAFDRVLELDPDLSEMPLPKATFWEYYGGNLLSVGRTGTVRRELGRVLHEATDPALRTSGRLWSMLGRAQQLEGDLAAAEETFRHAVRVAPTDTVAWTLLGQVLLSEDRPAEALEPLERALELAPNDWSVVYNLILANNRLGREQEVARLREKAETIRRTSGVPTSGMGGPHTMVTTPTP